MYEQGAKILARDHLDTAPKASISLARWVARLALAATTLFLPEGSQPAFAADLPYAIDLERSASEAAAEGKVLVVLYGTATCPWCAKVRRNYLAPLARAATAVITEIDPAVALPLTDFSGRATDHRSFAKAQDVRLVPTVVIYGPSGEALAEPIIGMSSEDFYGAYLEERLAIATKRLAQSR